MAITQIGVATLSDELLAYIKAQIKNGTLEWSDLIDTPDYVGQDGKFLKASSGSGSSSMSWQDLPAAGLNWQTESADFTATDKVGILASNGITITLPSTPSLGTLIAVADHNGEFDADPVTIRASNGLVIEGETDLILDLRNAYVQVVFDGTQWELVQVNHPFNVQEITEESFPGGQTSYNLARIPANRSSLLVSNGGYILPTTAYSVAGNVISFGTAPVGNVFVRHIGIPAAVKVSDTPIGAMLYFPNGEAVDGWLDCTGGSIGRSVYPDLVKYLSKDADAETAFLPDARGNFIRTWDHGAGLDTIGASTIPNILKTNEWGRWLDTTDVSTSSNLWDGNTTSRTTVRFDQGYVGYRFDAPVSASALHITTNDAIGGVHIPTSMQVKASNDGITWTVVSAADTGPFQNRTVTLLTNTADAYRYWAVFGTGGTPYVGNSDYYWGVTSLVFTATTQNRAIGGFQGQAVGTMDMTLNGSSTGVGQVQSGTGAVVPLAGATGTIEGGVETRPDNQSYVLRIKAFHYQSGSLSDSSVTQLRSEVSRLSTQINDGTSYVQDTAPENPSENARWYDTTSGRTYLWFNDGDSYQWVDDSPQSSSNVRESINVSEVLATGTTTKRALNERFADFINLLDNGALRNSASDSKVAFDKSGAGPVFVPNGTYHVSSGNYSGNKYFSYGPVTITGGSTGIVVINLGDVPSADSINWNGSNTVGYGLDDNEGFKEALLAEAGIVDNGLPDTAIASQRLDALKTVSVNETLDKLTDKVPLNGGVWASGQEFNFYNEYMIYNGEAYSPLPATTLPYAIGATPDLGFVYQIKLNSLQSLSGLTEPSGLDDVYTRNFKTIADLKAGIDATGQAIDMSLLVGVKVFWRGYYAESDGGGNWGVVKSGAHTDDGGSIFSIDANTYVEANIKGKTLNVRKFGVVADGSTIDTSYFKKAVTYGNHVKLTSGTLILDATVTLHSNSHIELSNGARIKQAANANLQQLFTGTSLLNITFTGVEVDLNAANQSNYVDGQQANRGRIALLSSCNNIRVYKGSILQTFGSSYYLIDCTDIKVERWKAFDNVGHFVAYPLYFVRPKNVLISNSEFTGRREFGGLSSAFGVYCKDRIVNVTVKSCTFLRMQCMLDGSENSGAPIYRGSGANIINCTLTDPIADTTIRYCNYGKMIGNTVRGSGDYGLSVGDCQHIVVNANVVENANTVGIGIRESTNCIVSSNVLRDPATNFKDVPLVASQRVGIYILGNSTGTVVVNNSVTDYKTTPNKMFHAIRVEDYAARVKGDDTSSALIEGNRTFGASSLIDIYADGVNNRLRQNFVSDSREVGIRLGNTEFASKAEGDFRNNTVLKKPTYYDGTQECALPKIVPTPANSTSAGTTGDIAFNSSFLYICNSTNSWRRVALVSF